MKKIIIVLGCMLMLLTGSFYFKTNTVSSDNSLPLEERKSVESYFIEQMKVSLSEAKTMAADGVELRIGDKTTLKGIVSNLYYYSFINDEKQFNKLLMMTKDTTPGREGAIIVGSNSIDINSSYYINYKMTDEEIANTLLNKGRYSDKFNQYNYLFMPSKNQK